jgi:hypothetical protein
MAGGANAIDRTNTEERRTTEEHGNSIFRFPFVLESRMAFLPSIEEKERGPVPFRDRITRLLF